MLTKCISQTAEPVAGQQRPHCLTYLVRRILEIRHLHPDQQDSASLMAARCLQDRARGRAVSRLPMLRPRGIREKPNNWILIAVAMGLPERMSASLILIPAPVSLYRPQTLSFRCDEADKQMPG